MTKIELFNKELLNGIVVKRIRTWIKALRSGEYKRTTGELCNNGRYCCLGVANEVCKLGERSEYQLTTTHAYLALWDYVGSFNWDSKAIKYNTLADRNDDGKYTFKEQADFIEKHLNKALEEIKNENTTETTNVN